MDTVRRTCIRAFFDKADFRHPLIPTTRSTWWPPTGLARMCKSLQLPVLGNPKRVMLNMTRTEKQALRVFQANSNLIVVSTDKNLGLAIIEEQEYRQRIWRN